MIGGNLLKRPNFLIVAQIIANTYKVPKSKALFLPLETVPKLKSTMSSSATDIDFQEFINSSPMSSSVSRLVEVLLHFF